MIQQLFENVKEPVSTAFGAVVAACGINEFMGMMVPVFPWLPGVCTVFAGVALILSRFGIRKA